MYSEDAILQRLNSGLPLGLNENDSRKEKRKKRKKDGKVNEKTKKDGTIKEKKKAKENSDKRSQMEKEGFGSVKKSIKGEKTRTTRISTSSFEIGHLSASPQASATKRYRIEETSYPRSSVYRLPCSCPLEVVLPPALSTSTPEFHLLCLSFPPHQALPSNVTNKDQKLSMSSGGGNEKNVECLEMQLPLKNQRDTLQEKAGGHRMGGVVHL